MQDLVRALDRHLDTGSYDVLELLYITRCLDLLVDSQCWTHPSWSTLAPGASAAGDASDPAADEHFMYEEEETALLVGDVDGVDEWTAGGEAADADNEGEAGSSSGRHEAEAEFQGTMSVPPPPWLSELVQSAFRQLGTHTLPPDWRRLNVRFPPYALPAEALAVQQQRRG